jgi:hypothetical protein
MKHSRDQDSDGQAMKKSRMKTEETQETQLWGYTIEVESPAMVQPQVLSSLDSY